MVAAGAVALDVELLLLGDVFGSTFTEVRLFVLFVVLTFAPLMLLLLSLLFPPSLLPLLLVLLLFCGLDLEWSRRLLFFLT